MSAKNSKTGQNLERVINEGESARWIARLEIVGKKKKKRKRKVGPGNVIVVQIGGWTGTRTERKKPSREGKETRRLRKRR